MIRKNITIIIFIIISLPAIINAGPHTVQRGETFQSISKLYSVSEDSIRKYNPGLEAITGLTIEVPNPILLYDIGDSDIFRVCSNATDENRRKGQAIFDKAFEKQKSLSQLKPGKREETIEKIIEEYEKAASFGVSDAVYQLGRYYIHGHMYSDNKYMSLDRDINPNIAEFRKGVEYLQTAAIVEKSDKARIALALTCGYEKSPIYNPYLCVSILEGLKNVYSTYTDPILANIYENGIGVRKNLLKAYVYCTDKEIYETGDSHREKIIKEIERMPKNFESASYGVGLDGEMMYRIGLSHYKDNVLTEEGIYWLHRASKVGHKEAPWVLASFIMNNNIKKGSIGSESEKQAIAFARMASKSGNEKASKFIMEYDEYQRKKREYELQLAEQKRAEEEARKRERTANILNVVGTLANAALNTYVAVQNHKAMNNASKQRVSAPQMPISTMTDKQWMARNQLALNQIANYTYHQVMSDWNGTPMPYVDMSAVNLGTDMTPGSPLWMWGQQQQINTIATQNAKMQWELVAYYKSQADRVTNMMIENPFQPISGIIDYDGNFISAEMIASDNSKNDISDRYSGFEKIREKNKQYYANRYGNKDCPSCRGTGKCVSCNGQGHSSNELTGGFHSCPNCYLENGHPTGLCRQCSGTGSVYGLKL